MQQSKQEMILNLFIEMALDDFWSHHLPQELFDCNFEYHWSDGLYYDPSRPETFEAIVNASYLTELGHYMQRVMEIVAEEILNCNVMSYSAYVMSYDSNVEKLLPYADHPTVVRFKELYAIALKELFDKYYSDGFSLEDKLQLDARIALAKDKDRLQRLITAQLMEYAVSKGKGEVIQSGIFVTNRLDPSFKKEYHLKRITRAILKQEGKPTNYMTKEI